MLKVCGETFSITKMPDFTVYTKCNCVLDLDHDGEVLNPGNPSEGPGARRLPLRHRSNM